MIFPNRSARIVWDGSCLGVSEQLISYDVCAKYGDNEEVKSWGASAEER